MNTDIARVGACGGGPLRILVVDDNLPNLDLAQFLLEARGYLVDVAPDAQAALRCLASRPIALILMDIQMPGMDGLSLTQHLKADPTTRDIVVVAYTAYASPQDVRRLLAGGCDGYLAKPIDAARFADAVTGFLHTGPDADGHADA